MYKTRCEFETEEEYEEYQGELANELEDEYMAYFVLWAVLR